jgi:hypothetical protein
MNLNFNKREISFVAYQTILIEWGPLVYLSKLFEFYFISTLTSAARIFIKNAITIKIRKKKNY